MIGYPNGTKGWLLIRDDGTLEATSHARFDTRNYMERAVAKGKLNPTEIGFDPSNSSFEETEGTAGMPLGGTDAEIRAKAKKQYEDDIIICSEPNEEHLPNKLRMKLRYNMLRYWYHAKVKYFQLYTRSRHFPRQSSLNTRFI